VPLTAEEQRLLPPLLALRLGQSLVLGMQACAEDPSNTEYLTKSHPASWAVLDMLRSTDPSTVLHRLWGELLL